MSRSTRANPAPTAKAAPPPAVSDEDAPVMTRQLSSTSRATQEANRAQENIFLFVPNLIGEQRAWQSCMCGGSVQKSGGAGRSRGTAQRPCARGAGGDGRADDAAASE
jgi:hypothetical protein